MRSRRHHAPDDDLCRDVLGLFRALLDRDQAGVDAITRNVDCPYCLAVGAAQVGLWLTAAEPEDVREGLSRLQRVLDAHGRAGP